MRYVMARSREGEVIVWWNTVKQVEVEEWKGELGSSKGNLQGNLVIERGYREKIGVKEKTKSNNRKSDYRSREREREVDCLHLYNNR